jgi:D-3-phosphoglycerate dehydrogenase
LGVLGCGAIGRTVASLATGLGMAIKAYDPVADRSFTTGSNFSFANLQDVLSGSDVITLHCPPTDRPLINAETLKIMRKGVVVINTARAELIDPVAMHTALETGHVSCYATDVYPSEPPEPSALLAHENTILMPHAGGLTSESVERATRIAVDNLLQALR